MKARMFTLLAPLAGWLLFSQNLDSSTISAQGLLSEPPIIGKSHDQPSTPGLLVQESPHYVIMSFAPHSGVTLEGKRFTGSLSVSIGELNTILEGLPVIEIRNLLGRQDPFFLAWIEKRASEAHPDRSFDLSRHYVIEFSAGFDGREAAGLLREIDLVERAEISIAFSPPYLPEEACAMPTDPNTDDEVIQGQWYLHRTEFDRAWADACGDGVVIADCDAGFQTDHWELNENFLYQLREDFGDLDDPRNVDDGFYRDHGTSVTGIMSAESNGLEIAGGAHESRVIPLQYYNYDGTDDVTFEEGVANCVAGAILRSPDIIVLEAQYGGSAERIPGVSDLVAGAVASGISVVAAAGNYTTYLDYEMENFTGSVIVGALNLDDNSAYFTNYGERVDCAAAGEWQYTTTVNNGFTNNFGGTSGATPVVVGAVANIIQLVPSASPELIRTTLRATSHPLETTLEVGGMVNSHGSLHGVFGDIPTVSLYPEQFDLSPSQTGDLDVNLYNGTGSTVQAVLYLDVYLPNGSPYPGNPWLGPRTVNLPAGTPRNITLPITAPINAPAGDYRLRAVMEDLTGTIIDSDDVTVTVN